MSADASHVESLVAQVCAQFDVGAADVRGWVIETYAQYEHARLQSFVPVLVEKQIKERLRAR